MGEWKTRRIGSLGRVTTGKTPSTKIAANFDGPYPFITIPDLDGRICIDSTSRTLSEEGATVISSCKLPPDAVMMSCIATVGRCGITAKTSFKNQQINSVVCNDDVIPRYLYYCFTQLGQQMDAAGGGGSVYTNVSKSRFSDIEVPIPPLPEQKAIAHILGTLDDKIELNRRMNETLEGIARVNRVFKDKSGGLVVDYLGLADQLKRALADYTEAGGRGDATVDQDKAVAVMIEKYKIVVAMFHGFDYRSLIDADPARRMAGIAQAMEHILAQEEGKKRYLDVVSALSKAFALAVSHEEAIRVRDEVAFFQEVRSGLAKATVEGERRSQEEMDAAIRQLVSRAVASDQVVDIFAAAGLKKPDISILSDDFLLEVRALPQRNLAVELLRKLLNDEIKSRARKNVVKARSFAEMLEEAVRKYQNRAIEAALIIEELIRLAKEMQEARIRGEALGLSDDEVAFYDALEVNDSAVKVLGDECLRKIAQELVTIVRRSVTIDWTVRENARAKIRVMVKRILRKYGYPPDKQEKAT